MLSVVVPVYDEQDVLPLFLGRLRAVLDATSGAYEALIADDGSRDDTPTLLHPARLDWPQLRVIRLRRNAGHQAALTAGLDRAHGDSVVTINADLQDPPELIPELLTVVCRDDADVVYAVRDDRRSDTPFKRCTAAFYDRTRRRVAGSEVRAHAGDYRLLKREVVEALRALPERHWVYRLLVPWLAFRVRR